MAVGVLENVTAENLFDQISDSYEDAYGDNKVLYKVLDRLKEFHVPGTSVLDAGCGPGGPASYLNQLGFDITGIDVSQSMIDYCEKSIPGEFQKADMTTWEPNRTFGAIVSLYSLFQLSHRKTYSTIFKYASWLRPDGTLILATIPAEDLVDDMTMAKMKGQYVERYAAPFMGRRIECTLITTTGWLGMLQDAGLTIVDVQRHSFQTKGFGTEEHMFITARRTTLEPLFGPHPLPPVRRAPHLLSQGAWAPFAERLTRHEFDATLAAVSGNKTVLDVGSGHGELPVAIAKILGRAYAIEPNGDRNQLLLDAGSQNNVEIRHGTAENLPYGDNTFDAAVALWILHYVDDLEKSLAEMARVVDPTAPNSRLVIVQGAPDNEVVNLINKACAPIAAQNMEGSAIDHQGLLLATAARVFTRHGFGDISLERVDAHCNFPEADVSVRCERAADVLTNFWYLEHPRADEMKSAFQPVLAEQFADREFEVGDQAVILIAKPTRT